jgi:HK97 family phage prohead protease
MIKPNDRQTFASRTTFHNSNARLAIKRAKFADGNDGITVTGYPIVWNTLSSDRGGYKVKLAKNSATFSTPTLALWHHQFDKPLGGTVNNTLRILAADDVGVPCEIDLDMNTSAGKDAYAYVSSKLVGGMSFSMVNGFESYTEDDEEDGFAILNVSKYTVDEVTITPIPAFAETSIAPKPEEEADPGTPPVAGGMNQATPNRVSASMKLRAIKLAMLKR